MNPHFKYVVIGFLRAVILAFDVLAFALGFVCLVAFGAVSLASLAVYNAWRVVRR